MGESIGEQSGRGSGAGEAGAGPRRWIVRVVFVVAGTVIALVAGEVAVRIFHAGPQRHPVHRELFTISDDPTLRYELVPGADDGTVRINADGFRGADVARRKPPGVFRIACVGDSICMGHNVEQDRTFAAQLERLLNRTYASAPRRFQVLNFAVTGYNITQVARTLQRRTVDYDPDLIVYAYCLNDPQEYSREFDVLYSQLDRAERSFRERVLGAPGRFALRSRLYALVRYAIESTRPEGQEHSNLGTDWQFRHLRQGTYGDYFTRLHMEAPGRGRLERGIADIAGVARDRGVSACVVVFPLFVALDDYRLGRVHRQVRELAEAQGMYVFDLTAPYQQIVDGGFGPMQVDPIHPSAEGHTVAALAILRGLLENGILPVAAEGLGALASESEPMRSYARILERRPAE